ncbi:MAG: hypothetical protein ACR2LE_07175 [Nocardioidaceae bacterium]
MTYLAKQDRIDADRSVFEAAVERLRTVLPSTWEIRDTSQTGHRGFVDFALEIKSEGGAYCGWWVEVKQSLSPRAAERLLGGQARRLLAGNPGQRVVVIAPWLSPHTQDVLRREDINYMDLTGNAWLRQDRPALYVMSTGAQRNPSPRERGGVTLNGVQAGRVARMLTDVLPPYTASQIANRTGVSLAYVSRLLTMLQEEALIQRGHRSRVDHVDWQGALRRRAESYGVFSTNTARGFISPRGPQQLLERLRKPGQPYKGVTGSFAAASRVHVTAPAQLLIYVDDVEDLERRFELLPTARGADVVLLRPYDFAVWERPDSSDGINFVSLAQAALDCLTGDGRMPAEGEALLTWMSSHETEWRWRRIDDLLPRGEILP